MRDKLIKVVREHRAAQGQCTGYFLVTFCDGKAVISGETDGSDAAMEIVQFLADAIGTKDDDDEIGPCRGTA